MATEAAQARVMSRSRKSTPSTPPLSTTGWSPPRRPYRSIASQMTFDHEVAVEEASAAELRGDWSTAFERHRAVPMFAESHHGAMLSTLAGLGEAAPRWLVTRFLTMMAHRHELYGQLQRSGRLLQRVVPLLYPHEIPIEALDCAWVEQIGPVIFGCDWVVRQVDVYDFGGLADLLAMPEAAGALALGEYVGGWEQAPMGGYRVVGADGEVLTIADAAGGEELELLDLGLTCQHPPGTHVLGRVVPTDTGPGRLFDCQPLPVDARIAREVAARPERWLDVIAARTRSRALPPAFAHRPDRSLTADLPQHAWAALLGHPIGERLPRPPSTMVTEALRAALTLPPHEVAAHRHLVAELLLDELVSARLLARFALPKYLAAWRSLAKTLPDPARRRCDEALWLIDAVTDTDELAG